MAPVSVRDLKPDDIPGAGAVVGRAMAAAPVFAQVYPTYEAKRTAALVDIYGALLKAYFKKGRILGAFSGETIVGVCAFREPGCCQLTGMEKLSFGKTVASAVSLGFSMVLQKTLSEAALRDPQDRHWHVGPVAVEPSYQRKGVGTALMHELCRRIDISREMSFLETDRKDVMRFFERSGYKELSQAVAGGVPHWFMIRSRM